MAIRDRPTSAYVNDFQRHFQLFYNAVDVLGRMTGIISALTAEPFKEIGCYLFPQAGAFLAGHTMIDKNEDRALEAQMPQEDRFKVLGELNSLIRAAGLENKKIVPYCTSKSEFSYQGGAFSSTLILPKDQLFRIGKDQKPFGQETKGDNLSEDPYRFTDNEIRFMTARLLSHIKHNDDLTRIALKVLVIAAILFTLLTPIGIFWGIAIFAVLFAVHAKNQKRMELKADIRAIKILQKAGVENPAQVAVRALKKLREQNLDKRKALFGTLVYTKEGDDRLALTSNSLSKRIALIEKKYLKPKFLFQQFLPQEPLLDPAAVSA